MKKNNPVSESEDETELPMEDGHEEDGEDKINGEEKEEEVPDFPQDFNPWMKTQKQLLEKIIAEQTTQEDVEDNEEDNTLEKKAAQKPVVQKDLKLSYFTVNDIAETKESDDETGIDAKTEERRKLVAEAFADDNVVDDFEQDKKAIIERERPKRKSSYLPGWGAWGGPSVKESKARKARFTAEVKAKKRKDASLGNVIISEKVNDSVSKFMVSEVPFPFKNVEQFENSIRHPVGSTWNTESAFRDLTEPAVVTKIGRIIEPMSRDYILKKETSRKPAKSGRKEEST
ncbi:U3 small nucleolar RNA-associated protein 14 -like protein A [Halotydeus destructor]|nr:U3 small nucleolar RNA-associated protein 14 -like protein A [Halotydeus destructor]